MTQRTPDGGSVAYRKLLDEMWALHIAKNTGYARHSAIRGQTFASVRRLG